jgi:phytoene dehydrogenase-like protein
VKVSLLVIGGGLSGLAAATRAARFNPHHVLLLEKHSRLGGLNSYFYRNRTLYETGLHAITNYAEPEDKKAPLNRLLRQLKLPRRAFSFCPQYHSEIVFQAGTSLKFSNDFDLLQTEIGSSFPGARDGLAKLLAFLEGFDPFVLSPFCSAKRFLLELLQDPLLVDMLLCPLMYYGSSLEEDMDLSQFAIMFRAIYQEGMFRPHGTIKDFLDLLINHYLAMGGRIETGCAVAKIIQHKNRAVGVRLASGEEIEADYLLSTIGYTETMHLLDSPAARPLSEGQRLGFVETIYQAPASTVTHLPRQTTIIFYNEAARFSYRNPDELVDFSSGVICFPGNFQGLAPKNLLEIRSTHLANYRKWKELALDPGQYKTAKKLTAACSGQHLENMIGSFATNIVYEDTFTPVTIERFTSKIGGAIYGNPRKTKDGDLGFANLFLAGTDQGFLGIIGSMLSGVSMVNQHILPKL